MARQLESEKMGTVPEGRLLLSMAVPMMLSMLVQSLYNIVDSMYVAMVSEDCLAALSLAFPAQNIMIGMATGTGVGVAALVSRFLGAGEAQQATKVAGNSLFLAVCCWLVMALFGLFGSRWFVYSQTADAVIRDHTLSYLRIVSIASLFVYVEIAAERLLQATGRTKLSMWTQMFGAVLNILLDPFFIFGWCGLPAMGTAGAAIATVLGQAGGAALGMYLHFRKNHELRIHLRDLLPEKKIISHVYKIGLPSILMMGVGSVTNYSLNKILIGFTSTAVAVFGAYFKIQSFIFMPIFGLNNGVVPIVSYNFGAGKPKRVYRTLGFGVLYAFCLMTFGFLLFQCIPGTLLRLFTPSPDMLAIGIPALRIISTHFPVAAFCIVAGSVCQALDKSFFSLINSLLRQIVALLPAAYFLSLTGNVNMVWWCFPIAEIMSAVASTFFLWLALRHMKKKLAQRGVL